MKRFLAFAWDYEQASGGLNDCNDLDGHDSLDAAKAAADGYDEREIIDLHTGKVYTYCEEDGWSE